MSVVARTYYLLKCDRCGTESTEDSEFEAWHSESRAVEDAEAEDWAVTKEGKHYCPECYIFGPCGDVMPLPRVTDGAA